MDNNDRAILKIARSYGENRNRLDQLQQQFMQAFDATANLTDGEREPDELFDLAEIYSGSFEENAKRTYDLIAAMQAYANEEDVILDKLSRTEQHPTPVGAFTRARQLLAKRRHLTGL